MTVLEPKEQAEILKNSRIEEQTATLDKSINLSLSNRDGFCALNFSLPLSVGKWDYVALCDGDPGENPYGYLTGQWQYISATNSPYVTGKNFYDSGSFWVIYVTWNYNAGAYRILAKSNSQSS